VHPALRFCGAMRPLGGCGSVMRCKTIPIECNRCSSFLKKKNQKTSDTWGKRCLQRVPQFAKVFASFFKKKRFLASYGSISMAVGIKAASSRLSLIQSEFVTSISLIRAARLSIVKGLLITCIPGISWLPRVREVSAYPVMNSTLRLGRVCRAKSAS
jgi:hypothetical protein